jgi:hypothetical protein
LDVEETEECHVALLINIMKSVSTNTEIKKRLSDISPTAFEHPHYFTNTQQGLLLYKLIISHSLPF